MRNALSILLFILPLTALALPFELQFAERNSLYIGAESASSGGISKMAFYRVIDRVEQIYAPIVSELGGTLKMVSEWEDGRVNASAKRIGTSWEIHMSGGLARLETMTTDAFAMVVCHEMGHHLGGYPKKLGWEGEAIWASAEGQSDYFATTKCMRHYFARDNNQDYIKGIIQSPVAVRKCSDVYSNPEKRAVCIRSAVATESLGRVLNEMNNSSTTISLSSPDNFNVLISNISKYPSTQCRIDTLFQGALCDIDPEIPSEINSLNAGYCARENGYVVGVRPLCWYAVEADNFLRHCASGNFEFIKLALQSSSLDVNKVDEQGRTGLYLASKNGYTEAVRLLLSIDNIDVNRAAPLATAAGLGHFLIVKYLLEHRDIDVNRRNSEGKTALTMALDSGFEFIAMKIKKAGGR